VGALAAVGVVALHLLLAVAVLRIGSAPDGRAATGSAAEPATRGPVYLELPRPTDAAARPAPAPGGATDAPPAHGRAAAPDAEGATPPTAGAAPAERVAEATLPTPTAEPAPTPPGPVDAQSAADADRAGLAESPTGEPPPLPAGAPPRYRTQLPAPATLAYRMQRGERAGRALLEWQFEPASGYRLSLGPGPASTARGAERWAWVSAGAFDAHGLAPRRYADTLAGRERRAVNFQREAGRVSWSASERQQPLPEGLQDRVSWLVQLAAVLNAEPALRRPGEAVELWVAGLRGEILAWRLSVRGPAPLAGADGRPLDTLLVVLEPPRPWMPRIELWLDPRHGHLPARLSFGARPPLEPLDLLREDLAAPPDAGPSPTPPMPPPAPARPGS
jgi:hypothetical protein